MPLPKIRLRPRADFAPTKLLPEKVYLEGAPEDRFKLFACGCEEPQLGRLERAPWMRLFPGFRHYQCGRCGTRIFRWKVDGVIYPPTYFRGPQDPPA